MAILDIVTRQVRRAGLPIITVYLLLIGLLAALGVYSVGSQTNLADYWLEPAAVAGMSPWIGLFSTLGVFLWWFTAVVCLYSGWLLRHVPGQRTVSRFFLSWGALTAFLAFDDFFMIHETAVPHYLSLSEDALVAVYVVIAGALILRFRELIRGSPYPIFGFALACFAASVVIDMIGPARFVDIGVPARLSWNLEYVVEDGFKLLGILAWGHYFALFSSLRIQGLFSTTPGKRTDSPDQTDE